MANGLDDIEGPLRTAFSSWASISGRQHHMMLTAKVCDRGVVDEAVDVLWDAILRADHDQAVVRLIGSGRRWQDDADCYFMYFIVSSWGQQKRG